MGTNAALDIAIALVLMYLVLSLIGTVVNEFIATQLKLRSSTLQNALKGIIDFPMLRNDFYNHGLIDGTKDAINGDHASYLAGDTFALALLSSLDPTKPIPGFSDIKTAIEGLPDCNIRDVLLAQLANANGSLDNLRNGVATYFDNAMDRVSGVYKRDLKWIALGIGALVVLALNADSISVGRALWNDASLRAEMVADAGQFLTTQQPAGGAAAANAGDSSAAAQIGQLEKNVRPLPVGWPDTSFGKVDLWSPSGLFWIVMKIVGLCMTALAISLGAPFWFDLLSLFMNIRGTGLKPDRTTPPSP